MDDEPLPTVSETAHRAERNANANVAVSDGLDAIDRARTRREPVEDPTGEGMTGDRMQVS
ncbi:hypothetical protein HNR23_001790 [Nocardiopsis mwathae]|uniref:Uncharacterized protein n=1 Tax=Nocardiopsis mwathae TaxID=1472723 RepID=A0A7W9YGI3_9ACTN|nr:hypothetical protein [Nocardiopsis mwathae]MBB6171730.1 hypothetical protein [Nocardiopsis mwathae]